MSWPLEGERTVWVRGQLLWILLCVLELTGHSSLTDGTSVGSSGEKKSACVVFWEAQLVPTSLLGDSPGGEGGGQGQRYRANVSTVAITKCTSRHKKAGIIEQQHSHSFC